MKVAIVRDLEGLRELEGAWNQLTRNSRFRAPFYSWAWQSIWWTHFADNSELFVVVARNRLGQVCAIAPLMKMTRRVRQIQITELSFAANVTTPRSSIIFSEDKEGYNGIHAIVKCISDCNREWDIVSLEHIDSTMPYLQLLSQSAHACGLCAWEKAGKVSPYVSIGNDFDQYLCCDTLTGRHRHRRLRRKMRALSQKGYRIVEFTRLAEMDEAMALTFSVAKATWKAAAGTDIASTDARQQFFTDIAKHFADIGQIRIWVSFLVDCPIAVEYHMTCGEKLYFIVNDFHQGYAKLSPGAALLYHIIESLHREKIDEFDFCGAAFGYKMEWATGLRRHVTIELYNSRCLSSLIYLNRKRIQPRFKGVIYVSKKMMRPVLRGVRKGLDARQHIFRRNLNGGDGTGKTGHQAKHGHSDAASPKGSSL